MIYANGKILLDVAAILLGSSAVIAFFIKDYLKKLNNSLTIQQFSEFREHLESRANMSDAKIEALDSKMDANFKEVQKNILHLTEKIK